MLSSDRPLRPLPAMSHLASATLTVGEVLDTFIELHVRTLKDPAPVLTRIKLYFGPLRDKPLDSLTVMDLERWAQSIRSHSKAQAVGCVSILRTMYRQANIWGLYKGENIARYVRKGRIAARKRYVTEAEAPALVTALQQEPPLVRLYFSLIYETGCRPGEARMIKPQHLKLWQDDKQRWQGVWTKPTTKTDEPQAVPLPSWLAGLASEVMTTIPATQPYLFMGREPGRCQSKTAWHLLWVKIRKRAGLHDVHEHDLRRSCSTDLLNDGTDLITLSKGVLNHSSLETTTRYAYPRLERVRLILEARSRKLHEKGDES